MKKLFSMVMLTIMMMVSTVSNAQTALETQKILDNVYVGVQVGARTPLSFDNVFPLDATASLRVGKDFTPVFGAYVEGTAIFGDNVGFNHEVCLSNTFVRGVNVGVNGTVNLTNLLLGYKGTPRVFELTAVGGLGWGHVLSNGMSHRDDLTAKTGLDLAFNLGKAKAWKLFIEPAVYWNLTGAENSKVQFNKNYAQLGLSVGMVYKFKTSNGTHNFKMYDVGDLNNKINVLVEENESLKNVKPTVIEKVVIKEKTVTVDNTTVIPFEKNSSVLTAAAKAILDKVPEGSTVGVVGTASPEGKADRNSVLSRERAQAVADYLIHNRNVEVKTVKGDDAGRLAIVTVQ